MKRILAFILTIMMTFSFCGCPKIAVDTGTESADTETESSDTETESPDTEIETLKGWSFQSNPGTNDYSVFFGLLDGKGKYIAASVDVDIRIVNDAGEEVYSATRSVSPSDFDDYENQIAGKQYLANVRIPSSEIKSGKSSSGTVYLTVYKDKIFSFDEVNCSALYCLPIEDVVVEVMDLPVELTIKNYDESVESVITVTDATYVYEKEIFDSLTITVFGQKTFGDESFYDTISYKLYDSGGYLVDSGTIFLSNLSAGDKFKDDSIVIYDVTPGETYTLQFAE